MTYSIWKQVQSKYTLNCIEKYSDDKIIVNIDIPRQEAIHLCLLYSPQIRLVSPKELTNQFIEYLESTISVYLRQIIK